MLVGLTLALLAQLGGARVVGPSARALAGIALRRRDLLWRSASRPPSSRRTTSHAVRRSTTPWRDSSPGPRSCSSRPHSRCWSASASFAVSAWRMTARQRRAGALAIVEAPEAFTGRIPRRVRGRSPAALAGYELPMGLLGFPGIGWLFAGFSFTASILLLAGPAVTWAVIPLAFSPFGQGPLSTIGWKVELVWIPATALVSTLLLYRAQRRRRILLDGPRPPAPRRRRGRGYRTRVSVAAARSCSCSSPCPSCLRWRVWAAARSATRTRRGSRRHRRASSSPRGAAR